MRRYFTFCLNLKIRSFGPSASPSTVPVTVGTPVVSGATVSATVLGEELGPKLVIFKFKQKVKYRRTTGHRQHLTRVRIDEISSGGRRAKAEAEADPETQE